MKTEQWSSSSAGTGDIKCPFWKAHNDKEIHCEGIIAGSKLIHRFLRKGEKSKQSQIFCCEMYTYCEIYRTLMQYKYNEEDGYA